jgi:Tol biopolymer transport system component
MTHDTDDRLVAWLAEGPAHGPTTNLERAFSVARGTRQRPAWLVAARGGTIAAERTGAQLRFGLVAITLLAITLIAGALVAGGLLPKPDPAPSPVVIASPDASPETSATPSPAAVQGRIVYTRWTRLAGGEGDCTSRLFCSSSSIFTANQDGSHERELIPGPNSQIVTVSPEGSSMLIQMWEPDAEAETFLTDSNGSEPQLLDTGCQLPCVADYGFTFSPDGSRLAFVRSYGGGTEFPGDTIATGIAILDMATGAVLELESTRVSNPDLGDPCHANCGGGSNEPPSWSPDGEHLVFARGGIGIPNRPPPQGVFLPSALFIVDADGTNFRQLGVPTDLRARDPAWSPDGSLVVFTSAVEQLALNSETGVVDNWQQLNDLYTVRPDGTDLQRLTTDTEGPVGTTAPVEFGARFPSWTRDGRIVFARGNAAEVDAGWQVWVMDRDGGNQTQLEISDAATLTAIGCVSCPYPEISEVTGYPSDAFWIPAP